MISAVSLVVSTLNYIEFYTAIQKLDLAVVDVSPTIEQNSANITMVFAIINPTRYIGLKIREISMGLYYLEANDTLAGLWWDTRYYYQQPISLNPYSNTTQQLLINLNRDLDQTKSFIDFYTVHQGNIKWELRCGVILLTFIDNVQIELSAPYFSHT